MVVWFVCRPVGVIVVVYLFRQWRAHSDVAWSLWRLLSLAESSWLVGFIVGGITILCPISCWCGLHGSPVPQLA